MMEIWCSWHRPHPIMIRHYGDGRKKVTRSHGICRKCMHDLMTERVINKMVTEIRARNSGMRSGRDGLD